jgi:hypothetical protein
MALSDIFTIAAILPSATIITFPGTMPAFISLSCVGICWEEDFRLRRWSNPRLPSGMAGSHQVETSRYSQNMGGFFLLSDKCRV